MFVNLFKEEKEDYVRYWANISTEIYDRKKKTGSGEYASVSISVRMFPDCAEDFDAIAKKSKKKKVTWANVNVTDFWLEAVKPKEGEPFLRMVVKDFKEPDEDD